MNYPKAFVLFTLGIFLFMLLVFLILGLSHTQLGVP